MYDNPEIFDDTGLSDVAVDERSYKPIVDHFKYLDSFISRGFTDGRDVDGRILKAENACGLIWKSLLGSQYVHDSVKRPIYKSLILPMLFYGAKCRCLTEWLFQNIYSFHNRCVWAMCCVNRMQTHLFWITTSDLLLRLSTETILDYVSNHWYIDIDIYYIYIYIYIYIIYYIYM